MYCTSMQRTGIPKRTGASQGLCEKISLNGDDLTIPGINLVSFRPVGLTPAYTTQNVYYSKHRSVVGLVLLRSL